MASNKLWIAGAFNRPSTPAQRISVRQSSKSPGTGPRFGVLQSERASERAVPAPCYPCCPMLPHAARVFRSQILMSWLLFSC